MLNCNIHRVAKTVFDDPCARSIDRINALLEAVNFTLVMSTPILVAIAGFATFVLTVRQSCRLRRC